MSMLKILSIFYLAVSGAPQIPVTSDPSQVQVTIESRTASSVSHASFLLRQAGVWGGIEDYRMDCGTEPDLHMPSVNGTLKEALVQLVAQDPSVSWRPERDGVLIRKNPPATSLLDTKIAEFTFDKNDFPDKTTDALLRLPIVQRLIAASNMSVRSPELGFAQLRSKSENILTLKDITLRQALNVIAHSVHPRVWLFRQTSCGGEKTLQVTWVVK